LLARLRSFASLSSPSLGLLGGASLAALLLHAAPARAVGTSTWTVETFANFDAGDATDAILTSLGELRPGWDKQRVAVEGDGVWSSLRLADGTVLIGSDDGATIVSIARGGKEAKKVVSIPDAIAVVALTQTPDGTVWAATLPGDKVYKIDLKAGKATPAVTLKGAETVWALAAAPDGTVYAGTGPDGKLWAIKGGAAKEVLATDDKRVGALAVGKDGAVWLGTSERALVFRYDPATGKARAMADFAGNEITAIAIVDGGVAVAANEMTEPMPVFSKSGAQVEAAEKPGKPKGTPIKPPDVGTKPGADKDSTLTDMERKGARKGKGAVFRVGDDGRVRQLHALTQTYITSLAAQPDGTIYAGAADKGRVYQVEADGAVATALDVDERAVSQLWLDDGKLGLATDDAAGVYRVTGTSTDASYVSDIFDARGVSQFGRLAWQGSGKVAVETRSGNTAQPGTGWSEWKAPADVGATGGGVTGGKIASPPGRYFQFRVALTGDGARFRRATAYYVPQNQATELKEVTVEASSRDSFPTLKEAASGARSPGMRVRWSTDNPDGDSTTYLVDVRRDGEATFRPLVTAKDRLSSSSWEWNTETFADGWYRVRVTASDAGSNTADRALTSTATSALVLVDNTRPSVDDLKVSYGKGAGRATARAADGASSIAEMAFSVDDGPWQLGGTDDGLFDDPREGLTVVLPTGLAAGSHTVAIRVADAAGNVGTATSAFVVQ
jgi:hypothetical protein